jgi:hypothetical protein
MQFAIGTTHLKIQKNIISPNLHGKENAIKDSQKNSKQVFSSFSFLNSRGEEEVTSSALIGYKTLATLILL